MSKSKLRPKSKTPTIYRSDNEVVHATSIGSLETESGRSIMRSALSEYRHHIKRYLILIAIVTVPNTIINLFPYLVSYVTVSFYVQLASLFMTTGLIWAVVHKDDLVGLAVRRSYYEGSSLLLRLVLLVVVLAAMALPAGLGLSLYALGTTGEGQVSPAVYAILAGLAVLLALPTLALYVRYGLSIYAIADGDSPIRALRSASRLTRGKFWLTTRRSLVVVLLLFAIIVPVSAIVALLILFTNIQLLGLILQLFTGFVIVPLSLIAFYRVYRLLQEA